MAEVQNRNANVNEATDAANGKKRKGFWSNITGRSSNSSNAAETDDKKLDQEPKRKGGLVNSLMSGARQAATKEVTHLAEDEAMKEVTKTIENNDGSQTTDTNNIAPDTTTTTDITTTPTDVLNASTNWAKRMADSAQQKIKGLQSLAS